MKTNQIMHRPFLHFTVRQMHKTGFLNCNDALAAVNEVRLKQGKSPKQLQDFFKSDHSEYLVALCKYLNTDRKIIHEFSHELKPADMIIVKKGKYGGTWLYPYYYTKFARWLSPEFEAMVDVWVTDNLLMFRDNVADAYKEMCKVLDMQFNIGDKGWEYARVAKRIAYKVFGTADPEQWNFGNQEKQHQREQLQRRVITALEFGNFKTIDDVINII
jgi:hypothetical protein